MLLRGRFGGHTPPLQLQLQLIQRAPIWRTFVRGLGGGRDGPFRGTFPAAFAIAMRVRWQIEQNILAHIRGEIDQLRSAQVVMDGKSFYRDLERKRLETTNAFQFDRLNERPRRPERPFGNPEVERIAQWPAANHVFGGKLGNRTFFLALQMESVGWNLAEMDFHSEKKDNE